MYAVIFSAKAAALDEAYEKTAERMYALAFEQYNCRGFKSAADGDNEIAISYWDSLEDIQRWKQDAEHLVAQNLGRTKWYSAYKVEVVEILRHYEFAAASAPKA